MQAKPPPLARLAPARRYQLRTGPAWRVALERLRALDPALASHTARGSTRALLDAARVVRSLSWAAAPERVRLGLPPERGDLDGWLRAGIVDAIAGRAPGRLDAEPDAHAYRQGHAAALLALYTTTPLWAAEEPAPMTEPDATHPTLSAALVAAQAEAKSLKRDGKNQHGGYKYATADQVADLGRQLLTRHGLAWSRISHRIQAPALALADIGNQTYVGDVVICWTLRHGPTGETICGEAAYPIVCSKQRPHEKATAASVTYGCGQIIQGVLCWDREDERHAVDRRADGDDDEQPRPSKPGKAGKADPLARERAELQALVASLAERDGAAVSAVWTWATRAAGLDGLALAVLDAEAIAEVGRVVRGKLAPLVGKRAAKTSAPAKSSPEHARLVARILGHAEALAGLREATVDEVMRAELRPDAAANLGGLALADLTGIEAALAGTLREESAP